MTPHDALCIATHVAFHMVLHTVFHVILYKFLYMFLHTILPILLCATPYMVQGERLSAWLLMGREEAA